MWRDLLPKIQHRFMSKSPVASLTHRHAPLDFNAGEQFRWRGNGIDRTASAAFVRTVSVVDKAGFFSSWVLAAAVFWEHLMPRGRKRAFSASLAGVVNNLQSALRNLVSDRDTINGRIAALEGALRAMNAAPAASSGGRRGGAGGKTFRKGSLKEYIHRVLSSGGTMAVKDITGGVMKLGFKTKNKTLAKSVGIALTQMQMVQKMGRGAFKLR
ncbi:MAG: hypothetical protein HZB38_12680 [Planctomycetes bacterium]|nr:hypothetical protein [Planctomycetota bacterium]